jgi:hypothetical protein
MNECVAVGAGGGRLAVVAVGVFRGTSALTAYL